MMLLASVVAEAESRLPWHLVPSFWPRRYHWTTAEVTCMLCEFPAIVIKVEEVLVELRLQLDQTITKKGFRCAV